MSGLLAGTTQATNAEKETDRLGGFKLLDSGVHLMEIETAYLHTAASGARAVAFAFKNDTGSLRITPYFTSGTAKGCKTFFERDNKQFNLPGFTVVNDIFMATLGAGLEVAELEERVIKMYNKDAGGELPTKVQMITNLLGKKVALGVIKSIEDKTEKGDDGEYHPTGETREANDINKVFTADGFTIPEMAAKNAATASGEADPIPEPAFITDWKDKYDGQVINNAKGAKDGATGNAAAKPKQAKKMFS